MHGAATACQDPQTSDRSLRHWEITTRTAAAKRSVICYVFQIIATCRVIM